MKIGNNAMQIQRRLFYAKSIGWRSKQLVVLVLAILCFFNLRYYLSFYLADEKTTVTSAEFYGEQHQSIETHALRLPRFTICFSKVFVYTRLHLSDIKMLYNESSNQRPPMEYAWKPDIQNVILQAKFGSNVQPAESVFEPFFYKPSVTCWRTKEDYKVFATREGHVNTFDMIINAGVYDDVMADYKSAVVYLYIIPFTGGSKNKDSIGDLHNAIAISPGRYSSVGFHVTKTDSTFRNKKDERTCDKTGKTPDICISKRNKAVMSNCDVNVNNISSDVHTFYTCGMRQQIDPRCYFEPCKYERFTFTKSDSYIKYDKKLSVLNLTDRTARQISGNIARSMDLDSRYNPWRRKSFLDIATGVDDLTDEMATHLQKFTGFRCDAVHNLSSSLAKLQLQLIPKVDNELSLMKIIQTKFIQNSNKLYRFITGSIVRYAAVANPCFQNANPIHSTVYLLPNAKPNINLDCLKTHCREYNTTDYAKEMREYGSVVNGVLSAAYSLFSLSDKMLATYMQLTFTRFIDTFSHFGSNSRYIFYRDDVVNKLNEVRRNLFEGKRTYVSYFAYDDEKIVLDSRSPGTCTRGLIRATRGGKTRTFRDVAVAKSWTVNYDHSSCLYSHIRDTYTSGRKEVVRHDVVIGDLPKSRHIPAFVYAYCAFYQNYLAAAETYFSVEPAYSLSSRNSLYSLPPHYSVYTLNSLFNAYDTSYLLATGYDGINRAEGRSCLRIYDYPLHTRELQKEHPRKLQDKTMQLMGMIADYRFSLQKYEQASETFMEYYKQNVVASVGGLLKSILLLRDGIHHYQKLKTKNANHKVFLVNRLKRLAVLTRNAIGGSGEALVSAFLRKKGTILIGEIQIELAEVQRVYESDMASYVRFKTITDNIRKFSGRNSTIYDIIFNALMTTTLHAEKTVQGEMLNVLESCNEEKWKLSKARHKIMLRTFSNWIINVTAMVHRAKRYTNSLLLSKDFMRKNMMHISLFYDSLMILTETSKPKFTRKELFAQIGNVGSIYLRITMFSCLELFCVFIVASIPATNFIKKWFRFRNGQTKQDQQEEARKISEIIGTDQVILDQGPDKEPPGIKRLIKIGSSCELKMRHQKKSNIMKNSEKRNDTWYIT